MNQLLVSIPASYGPTSLHLAARWAQEVRRADSAPTHLGEIEALTLLEALCRAAQVQPEEGAAAPSPFALTTWPTEGVASHG